jgi:hypothetical protein
MFLGTLGLSREEIPSHPPAEVNMQSFVSGPAAPTQAQSKPRLSSFDSSPEFSLAHWLEVHRLVELSALDDRELKGYVFDDSCLLVSE